MSDMRKATRLVLQGYGPVAAEVGFAAATPSTRTTEG